MPDNLRAREALALAIAEAAKAGKWDVVADLSRQMDAFAALDSAKHSDSVLNEMISASAKGPPVKPPSMNAIADWLGCTPGFLSQCRSGLSRIRRSWALRIAKARPDLPATAKTWPGGWAKEPEEK